MFIVNADKPAIKIRVAIVGGVLRFKNFAFGVLIWQGYAPRAQKSSKRRSESEICRFAISFTCAAQYLQIYRILLCCAAAKG